MNCCSDEHPDCRHISKEKGRTFWFCARHNMTSLSPKIYGCRYYEAPGEYALRVALQKEFDDFDRKMLEYDLWRHELLVKSIRDGILYAVATLSVLALIFWWAA